MGDLFYKTSNCGIITITNKGSPASNGNGLTDRLYTAISHLIAIVTDGTAILGLGDIGLVAGMPVTGGQSHADGDAGWAFRGPIPLNSKDVEQNS